MTPHLTILRALDNFAFAKYKLKNDKLKLVIFLLFLLQFYIINFFVPNPPDPEHRISVADPGSLINIPDPQHCTEYKIKVYEQVRILPAGEVNNELLILSNR